MYICITIPGVWNGKLLFHSTLNIPGQSGFPVVCGIGKWKVCFPFHTSSVEFQGNVAFLFTYTVHIYVIVRVLVITLRETLSYGVCQNFHATCINSWSTRVNRNLVC